MRALALLSVVFIASDWQSPAELQSSEDLSLRMYNVQDRVSCVINFGGRCDTPDAPDGCNRFVERIKRALPPVWDEDRGISLVFQSGLLIVRAPEVIHRAVRSHVTSERSRVAGGGPGKK